VDCVLLFYDRSLGIAEDSKPLAQATKATEKQRSRNMEFCSSSSESEDSDDASEAEEDKSGAVQYSLVLPGLQKLRRVCNYSTGGDSSGAPTGAGAAVSAAMRVPSGPSGTFGTEGAAESDGNASMAHHYLARGLPSSSMPSSSSSSSSEGAAGRVRGVQGLAPGRNTGCSLGGGGSGGGGGGTRNPLFASSVKLQVCMPIAISSWLLCRCFKSDILWRWKM
jgi:hypothetical protein